MISMFPGNVPVREWSNELPEDTIMRVAEARLALKRPPFTVAKVSPEDFKGIEHRLNARVDDLVFCYAMHLFTAQGMVMVIHES